ncbi:FUSC family protein [Streptomyces sp. CB01881]|uniref:FUSC family protein n=1 Tax=Streptomyces sp. CB01881 TaxID=2078691 RepID=UPI001F121B7F|nr:FUSC family protein [Streptomyces sp. CB01881]
MALPAVPLALAGHADQAVYTMLGSFATTFGHNLPYARRARVLALVAVAMTACVGCGSALAAWAHPRDGGAGAAVVIAAMAVVAGIAKFACDAARLGGLGAVLLLFSFAVAANGAPAPADVLPQTGLAALGAAVAWGLAVAGWFVYPDRPQRLAVAAALRELTYLWEATGGGAVGGEATGGGAMSGEAAGESRPARHRATAAVLQAYRMLDVLPPTAAELGAGRGGTCVRLTDLSWSLLIGSGRRPPEDVTGLAQHLRGQVRLLVSRRHREPPLLSELSPPAAATRAAPGQDPAGPATRRAAALLAAELRAAELLTGQRGGGPGHSSVLLVPALRMALGTGLAGWAALPLGLGHAYWAAISAAAVLHSVNVRTAAQRAVQRTLGTAAGLVLALGVLAAHPGPVALVLVIVLLEFLLEYVVARNYGLGVVFLTPLALLLTDLAAPSPTGTLVTDRVLSSVLGIGIALACALLVVHDRAAVRAQRALAACTEASEHAEQVLESRLERSFPVVQTHLAAAVVELREADDAAAGDLWPAEVDPTELAAAEQRAYLLLERFVR